MLDRPEASITGITDPRLRNPTEQFRFATVRNSAVANYFRSQAELATIFRTMEANGNYDNPDDAIRDVVNGRLHAFIWDSSRLYYEAAHNCELVTAGEVFGRSGYAVGLPKHSPWMQDVNIAILSFHERGDMEKLDNKYIFRRGARCVGKESVPATLGLGNMAGVFMLVVGGIGAGCLLLGAELAYKRRRASRERRLALARRAVERWRLFVRRKQIQRTFADAEDLNERQIFDEIGPVMSDVIFTPIQNFFNKN